jgi:hypothetical protein
MRIFRMGLMFCIPSVVFWAVLLLGIPRGDATASLTIVLGLVSVCVGLPWNVALAFAWDSHATSWLSDTMLRMCVPGAFINGVIVGWITTKFRKSSRE